MLLTPFSSVPVVLRAVVWLLQKIRAHMERGGTWAEDLRLSGPRGKDGRHSVLWWVGTENVPGGVRLLSNKITG